METHERGRERDIVQHSRNHKNDRKQRSSSYSSEDELSSTSDTDSSTSRSRSRSRSPHHRKHSKKKKKHKYSSRKHKHHKDRRGESKERNTTTRESDDRRLGSPDLETMKQDKRRQKELMKATETPEEKRARRLAKKDAKERKQKAKMGWDKEYMGYSNVDNPFGDENLLSHFVWGKKLEKEGKKSLQVGEIERQQTQKMIESRIELEKVKKRRLEREREQEEREMERENMQREKELDYFREWEKQEDNFHLHQAKLRSEIRIHDGRAKPIDLLAKYISAEDDELAIEMHEPYSYLDGMTINDLDDLLEDIKVYLELEEGKNADYWRDIIIVTKDELEKLKKIDPSSKDHPGDRREGVNQAVASEVSGIFREKTTNQLILLQKQIKQKLCGGEGVDIGYWESLLAELKAHMARTRLRERHQDVLRQKLFKLKQEQGIQSEPLFPIMKTEEDDLRQPQQADSIEPGTSGREENQVDQSSSSKDIAGKNEGDASEQDDEDDGNTPLITEDDLDDQGIIDYQAGKYSPRLINPTDLDIDAIIYDVEDDIKKLDFARDQVRQGGKVRLDGETEFIKKAREGMNDEEAQFSVEVPLDQQAFLWSDKYRPRKPRFFNRVHTGFEWNKYNQTHYDIDNPPPKIVQGYKFNIFYPDLIDKRKTPEYTLTPIEGQPDFSTLRFKTGPPYEDIAFKIVNREWEYSWKRGFRCQFQNNIFQLWFHFKRFRYRR